MLLLLGHQVVFDFVSKLPQLLFSFISKLNLFLLRISKIETSAEKFTVWILLHLIVAIAIPNRFHVARHLFSNRSEITSKCYKNKKVTHEAIAECITDVLKSDVFCDLLLNK